MTQVEKVKTALLTHPDLADLKVAPSKSMLNIEFLDEESGAHLTVARILVGSKRGQRFGIPLAVVNDLLIGPEVEFRAAPTYLVFERNSELAAASLGDALLRGRIENEFLCAHEDSFFPFLSENPAELDLVTCINRCYASTFGALRDEEVDMALPEALFRRMHRDGQKLLLRSYKLRLRNPGNVIGNILLDSESWRLFYPRPTGTGTVDQVVREAAETGFGAAKEWWVKEKIERYAQDLGLAKGRDFEVSFVGAGSGDPRVILDRRSKQPDVVFKLGTPVGMIPLFYVEVTGDGNYWMTNEVRDALIDEYGGKYSNEKYKSKIEFAETGTVARRGQRFQDNIPKLRALKLNDAIVFWVYVCDLTKALGEEKACASEERDLHGEKVKIGVYKDERLIHACFVELGQLFRHASSIDAKRIGSIYTPGRGVNELKLCVRKRDMLPFSFKDNFPLVLERLIRIVSVA